MSGSYRFSPTSWETGSRDLNSVAQEFASQANTTLNRVSNQGDLGGGMGGKADQAVSQIVAAVAHGAGEAVLGISRGLAAEATIMAITGRAYADIEASNESIAGQVGQ